MSVEQPPTPSTGSGGWTITKSEWDGCDAGIKGESPHPLWAFWALSPLLPCFIVAIAADALANADSAANLLWLLGNGLPDKNADAAPAAVAKQPFSTFKLET